ncbi:MAG: DNA repair protein RadC [Pseudomonadota bacterium]
MIRHPGFSEQALRGLEDLERRSPPPEVRDLLDSDVLSRGMPRQNPPSNTGFKRPHYWGHRERLRTRFLEGGADAVPEYELLEMILFNAIGRIDVKPLAKTLLATFGDLNGVIAAPKQRLLQIAGTNPKVFYQLRLFEAVSHRMARAKMINRCALSSWSELMAYCKTVMAHRDTEQFRVLFLDRKNILTGDEAQAQGTVDHVPVYPREVVKRALELNASAIILVHNHPSGDPTPSRADVEITRQINKACNAVGVVLHDHVIIGKETDLSFRSQGLI